MLRRSVFALALAVFFVGAVSVAQAADPVPYTQAAFDRAQAAGAAILVDIHAPWCPTCRAQEPVIARLVAQPENAGIIVFRVDFDSQKDIVRRFDAQRQSTLIAFRGRRETGRNVGVTAYFEIDRLLSTTRSETGR